MHKIRLGTIAKLRQFLIERYNIDTDAFGAVIDIDFTLLDQPDQYYPLEKVAQLLEICAIRTNAPEFAFSLVSGKNGAKAPVYNYSVLSGVL